LCQTRDVSQHLGIKELLSDTKLRKQECTNIMPPGIKKIHLFPWHYDDKHDDEVNICFPLNVDHEDLEKQM